MAAERNNKPLLNVLCDLNGCAPEYLPNMLRKHPKVSYDYIEWLLKENNAKLMTTHLKKKNIEIVPNSFTRDGANELPAFGRHHLYISVEEYFFSKHGISLKYPTIPCIVVLGGRRHKSYYPIECLSVVQNFSLTNCIPTVQLTIQRALGFAMASAIFESLGTYSVVIAVSILLAVYLFT
jgi:hypothetical protein